MTHKPPKSCYIRRWLIGCSPSAMFSRCTLGLIRSCKHCAGCSENVPERIAEGLKAGIEEGIKNPRWRIEPDGTVTELRPATPEEQKMLNTCRRIAERAFGAYDKEGEQ